MTINELRTPVNSSKFNTLLPEATLREVIEPLERTLRLRGVIAVYDVRGEWQYGPVGCEQPVYEAPIVVDNQEIGVVAACFLHEQEDVQDALDYLAHVLSLLASETSRRRKMADEVLERYDELNLIYDLASLISSHNLSQDELMRAVLEETNRILHAEAGVIYIYDKERGELVPISYFGRRSNEQYWHGRTRELALSTLYAYDTTQLFEGGRVLCAPLRYDDERLGALVLMHEAAGKVFSANDINLLTTLAHNTALFIRAARLFESLTQRNRELEVTLAELQSTRDELSRAERLSIIGQIVGGLVHDMRNPLNIVMGYAGLLQESSLTEAEVSEYATQIIAFVNTFSSMAQEILDYARDDERIERRVENLDDYMAFVKQLLLPPGLRRTVKIDVQCAGTRGLTFYADRQRFSRVFQNLVNNAIDAIEEKGGSRVVVRAEPTDDSLIRFSVSDDGPGVPPEILDTMFEPLTTTKAQGTGLGLAIVRRMVLKHGGDIHYEPSPEGGATFVFTVPQA
jgi:signal transduction histidine kinase